jgi:hypothetical protein
VNVVYLVGSRHEGYGESRDGASCLSNMLFIKSTHDRNIKKELEDHGARGTERRGSTERITMKP